MSDPRVVTTLDSFCAAARDRERDESDANHAASSTPPGYRTPVEARISVSDPFLAYRRARDGDGSAFLETTGGQPGWGYFGVDPVDRLTVGPAAVT
ncbi:anthranilate synthase component I, partial [Natrinema soli]